MYTWLPGLCHGLRGNLVTIYWILIIPLVAFLIALEFFKTYDQQPDVINIIKRAIISILLLLSFEEMLHMIAFVGDGIASHIGGMNDIHTVLQKMWERIKDFEFSLLKLKKQIIWMLSLVSYIAAYFGVFVSDALIHFCWAILYIVSPLMILAYIPTGTMGICKNLYKSLCTIMCWKILWVILGSILLKFSTEVPIKDGENFNAILLIVTNFFVGLSMLVIPIATNSLIGDGLTSFTTGLATAPAQAMKAYLMAKTKLALGKTGGRVWSGTKATTGRALRPFLPRKQPDEGCWTKEEQRYFAERRNQNGRNTNSKPRERQPLDQDKQRT